MTALEFEGYNLVHLEQPEKEIILGQDRFKLSYYQNLTRAQSEKLAKAYIKLRESSRDLEDITQKLSQISKMDNKSRIATLEDNNQDICSLITIVQDKPGDIYRMLHSFNQNYIFESEREDKFIKEVIATLEREKEISLVVEVNDDIIDLYKDIGFEISKRHSNQNGKEYFTLTLNTSRVNYISKIPSISSDEFLETVNDPEEYYILGKFKETKIFNQFKALSQSERQKLCDNLFEIYVNILNKFVSPEQLINTTRESLNYDFYMILGSLVINNSYENPEEYQEIFSEYLEFVLSNKFGFNPSLSVLFDIKDKNLRNKYLDSLKKFDSGEVNVALEIIEKINHKNLTKENTFNNILEFQNHENHDFFVNLLYRFPFLNDLFLKDSEYFKKFLSNLKIVNEHSWAKRLFLRSNPNFGTSINPDKQKFSDFQKKLEGITKFCEEIEKIYTERNKKEYMIVDYAISRFEDNITSLFTRFSCEVNFDITKLQKVLSNLRTIDDPIEIYHWRIQQVRNLKEDTLSSDDLVFMLEAFSGDKLKYEMLEKYFANEKRNINLKEFIAMSYSLTEYKDIFINNLKSEVPNLYLEEEIKNLSTDFLLRISKLKKENPNFSSALIFYIAKNLNNEIFLDKNFLNSQEVYKIYFEELLSIFKEEFIHNHPANIMLSLMRLKETITREKNLDESVRKNFLDEINELKFPRFTSGYWHDFDTSFNKLFDLFPYLNKPEKKYNPDKEEVIYLLLFEFAKGNFNKEELEYAFGILNDKQNIKATQFSHAQIISILERLLTIPGFRSSKILKEYPKEYIETNSADFASKIFGIIKSNIMNLKSEEIVDLANLLPKEYLKKTILNDFIALSNMPGPTDRKEKAVDEVINFLKNEYFANSEYFDEAGFFEFSNELLNVPKDLRLLIYKRHRGTVFAKFYDKLFSYSKKFSSTDFNIIRQYLVYIEDSSDFVKNLFLSINRIIHKQEDLNKKDVAKISYLYASISLFESLSSMSKFTEYINLEKISKMSLDEIYNYFIELKKKLPKIIFTENLDLDSLDYIEEVIPGTREVLTTYVSGSHKVDKDYITMIINSFRKGTGISGWRDFKYRNIFSGYFFNFLTPEQINAWTSNFSYEDIEELKEKFKNHPQIIHKAFMEAFQKYEPIGPLSIDELEVHNFLLKLLNDSPEFGSDDYYFYINKTLEEIQYPLNIALDRKNLISNLEFNINKFARGRSVNLEGFEYDLKFLATYFTVEQFDLIRQNFSQKKNEGLKTCSSQDLIPDHLYEILKDTLNINEYIYNESLDKINQRFKLNLTIDSKDLMKVISEIKNKPSVKIISQILKILSIDTTSIAKNKLDKSSTEKLTEIVNSLDKYFKFTGFSDLFENIRAEISNVEFERSELIYIISDSPLLLAVCGEYPKGSSSCQNYINGSHKDCLGAYIGDSHNKVAYAIQRSKLTDEQLDIIVNNGPDSKEFHEIEKEILPAIIARTIIKLGRSVSKTPSIIIEPTYTKANKNDYSYDEGFYKFLKSIYKAEDGFEIFRPTEQTNKARLPKSDNYYGTYEDRAYRGTTTEEYSLE